MSKPRQCRPGRFTHAPPFQAGPNRPWLQGAGTDGESDASIIYCFYEYALMYGPTFVPKAPFTVPLL